MVDTKQTRPSAGGGMEWFVGGVVVTIRSRACERRTLIPLQRWREEREQAVSLIVEWLDEAAAENEADLAAKAAAKAAANG